MKKTYFMLLLFLLLSGLLVFGCGDPEITDMNDGADDGVLNEDEVAGEEDYFISADDWKAPGTIQDIMTGFKEIRHSITQNGEEMLSIHYMYEGSETVEGVEADKITVDFGDEGDFTAWLDSNGEFLRLQSNGGDIPIEFAEISMHHLLENLMMPFQISSDWDVQGRIMSPVSGINIQKTESRQESFGDISATVHTMEVQAEPPAVPAGEGGKYLWHIADFGDFQTIVGWEMAESNGTGFSVGFKIDKIVPR